MDFAGNCGLEVPRGGLCPRNHLIPDVTFAPLELDLFDDRPERDRGTKRHCYAKGAIALYLLIDRENAAVTLFAEPADEDYRQHCRVPVGKSIPLPAPFSFDLDTSEFG